MTSRLSNLEAGITPAEDGRVVPTARAASRTRLLGYLTGLAIAALWGGSFAMTKAALGWVGPMSIAFLRWGISTLVLLGWISYRGKLGLALQLVRTDWRRIFWLALTGITLFYALENTSMVFTTATNAGILSNLTTVFMVLMAVVWFGERLRLAEWIGLAVAFTGAILLSLGSGHVSISTSGLLGDSLMVIATVFAAFYSMGSRRLTARYPADVSITLIALAGSAMLLPLSLREGMNLALPPAVWASLLLLGVGAGALANIWWLHLLSYMEAAQAGMVLFLVPVFSTVLAITLLHEPLTPAALAGAVLVLVGVAATRSKT